MQFPEKVGNPVDILCYAKNILSNHVEREDTNSTRKKSCAKEMVRRKLKLDAIPSKWPDYPKLFTKPVSNKRTTSNAMSSAREERATLTLCCLGIFGEARYIRLRRFFALKKGVIGIYLKTYEKYIFS